MEEDLYDEFGNYLGPDIEANSNEEVSVKVTF